EFRYLRQTSARFLKNGRSDHLIATITMNARLINSLRIVTIAIAFGCASLHAGDPAPPLLTFDVYQDHPRLAWTNVPRETYQILTREHLEQGNGLSLLTLTTDGKSVNWLDEASRQPSRFYQVVARADTNWASKLQVALDNGRKTYGVKGLSAVVITTN